MKRLLAVFALAALPACSDAFAQVARPSATPRAAATPRPASSARFPLVPGGSAFELAVLADSPSIYYRLNETGDDATADDTSGNARHGTYAGTPSQGGVGISDDAGTSVQFDGTNDALEPTVAYSPTITNLTQEAWIKTANPMPDALSTIFSWQNSGAGGGIALGIGSAPGGAGCGQGRLWCGWTEPFVSEIACSLARIDDGNWHHVACVWDGTSGVEFNPNGQITIYIDGTADVSGFGSFGNKGGTAPYATDFLMIASTDAGSWDNFTAITVDEVAVYESALSEARIDAHFALGDLTP